MFFSTLKDLISYHKDYIGQEMKRRLGQLPYSPYQKFILQTEEGNRRFDIWIGLLINSLEGNRQPFFLDQEQVGYSRSLRQGFHFEFVSQVFQAFQETLREILKKVVMKQEMDLLNLPGEIEEVNEILFQAITVAAVSWLKNREEQITEKVDFLQELYKFSQRIIGTFEIEMIGKLILRQIAVLFRVNDSHITIYRDHEIQGVYSYPSKQVDYKIKSIMENTWRKETAYFIDEAGDIYTDINQFKLKRVVSLPIQAHGNCYGVVVLKNSTKGFKFTYKEFRLLNQFLFVTAIGLENAFMVEEIQKSHQQLRLLTSKMITFQENERKRLASDIHDTIAQTLAGVSYKIQYCKELATIRSKLLIDQLDNLNKAIRQAIDQSRELISALRPDLIDTIGLVPAIKRFIKIYTKETGIRISARLTEQIQVSPDLAICLFRIIQEALTNVYKHANAKTAKVILQKKDGNIILVVSDDGKGFDSSREASWVEDQNKLGLLSMKERTTATGGILSIYSKIHKGCQIEAKIPFKANRNSHE